MKHTPKLFLILIIAQLIYTNPAFPFEIKDRNEYLIDVRGDDGDIYLNRLSLNKKMDSPSIELFFFGETQWNFDTSEWEKINLGIGGGKDFCKYLYLSQSVQSISGQMLDYMAFSVNNKSIDTTTKIALKLPILKHLSFHIFEEYSLNIEKGRDEYCETVAEILYSPRDLHSIGIGWRHTDRIHNFDSDYASLSFTLQF